MDRIFRGYIARGVQAKKNLNVPSHLRPYALDLNDLRIMDPQLVGLPIMIEHMEDSQPVVVGRVQASRIHSNGDWEITFNIRDEQSNENSAASFAAAVMDLGYARSLSLTHLSPEMKGEEISIVQVPAREGSDVFFGFNEMTDMLKAEKYKHQYQRVCASAITRIRASSSSAIPDTGRIRAALPPVPITMNQQDPQQQQQQPPQQQSMLSGLISTLTPTRHIHIEGLGTTTSNPSPAEQRMVQMMANGTFNGSGPFQPPSQQQQRQEPVPLPTLATPPAPASQQPQAPANTTATTEEIENNKKKTLERDGHGRFTGKGEEPKAPSPSNATTEEDEEALDASDENTILKHLVLNRKYSSRERGKVLALMERTQKETQQREAEAAKLKAKLAEQEAKLALYAEREAAASNAEAERERVKAHSINTWGRNSANGLTHPQRGNQIAHEIANGSLEEAQRIARQQQRQKETESVEAELKRRIELLHTIDDRNAGRTSASQPTPTPSPSPPPSSSSSSSMSSPLYSREPPPSSSSSPSIRLLASMPPKTAEPLVTNLYGHYFGFLPSGKPTQLHGRVKASAPVPEVKTGSIMKINGQPLARSYNVKYAPGGEALADDRGSSGYKQLFTPVSRWVKASGPSQHSGPTPYIGLAGGIGGTFSSGARFAKAYVPSVEAFPSFIDPLLVDALRGDGSACGDTVYFDREFAESGYLHARGSKRGL